MTGQRSHLFRLLLAVCCLLTLGLLAQVTRDGTLVVRVLDAATGRPTPVRILLQGAGGTTPRATGAVSLSESAIPIPKQALAVMWGQQDRAQGYALQPDGSFYVDGAFDVGMPPGTYTLTISKGLEYIRRIVSVDLGPGATTEREYRLRRWIDMPARGWYSSDDHIHLRRSPQDDPNIARWIDAEDIHVGNLLEMGDFWATYFSQYAFGAAGRYEHNGRLLSPGQEEPRTPEVGHTISLGAREFVRFRGDYYSYDRLFDRVHELGGVTGFAHQGMSFHGYRGMVLNTLRGKNDFLELAQFCVPEGPLALDHYYFFLDLGVKLTALAGSDFPWCGRRSADGVPGQPVAQIGNARFYAYLGGPLSYERWFAALKAGHTFVTTGPILQVTVNGHLPGDVVDVARGSTLRISAEAFGHDAQVPLRALEIIGHGQVLARSDGATSHLTASLELPADHGLWIAARCQAGPGQIAHTTPVYVTVGGDGFHNPQTAGQHLDVAESYLKELEQELARPGSSLDSQAARHKAPLDRQIADARATIATMRLSLR